MKLAATGTGQRAHPPVPVASHYAVRRAAAALAKAQARAAARQDGGRAPVRNITDPDSRLMPVRGGGFTQGYNAQNVVSEDGLVIATTLTQDTGDTGWFKPMMAAAQDAADYMTARQPPPAPAGRHDDAAAATSSGDSAAGSDSADSSDSAGRGPDSTSGQHQDTWRTAGYRPPPPGDDPGIRPGYDGPIRLLLADAGYCSEDNIAAPGPARLIATGKRRDLEKTARDNTPGPGDGDRPRAGPHTAAMTALLATAEGITAYRHRGHIAETPHGDIKHNKGFRQLSVRGLAKASSEWQFAAATANLFKAITTSHLTHTALDHLATQAGYPAQP